MANTDEQRLLELIEEGITLHGGDLGGWTQLSDEGLKLFDGRVTVRVELSDAKPTISEPVVHAHILTTLHDHDDEILDACVFGMGSTPEQSLKQATAVWITGVAGPIRSFLDNQPVCMTCQVGVAGGDPSKGFIENDHGLTGMRAYVGPATFRGFSQPTSPMEGIEDLPWFRYAAESAAPRHVHLAKVSVLANPKTGWSRVMEIDGHDVSYSDPAWAPGVKVAGPGYGVRYAVFEFPRNSQEVARRKELDRAIWFFAENYGKHESVDTLLNLMVEQGFDLDLIHQVESTSTIALGRALFEPMGVEYAQSVIRARSDWTIVPDVALMSIPAFSRARALAVKLREVMPDEAFQALCCYSAESNALIQAMNASEKEFNPAGSKMYPCVVPDREVSKETMDQALALLHARIEQEKEKTPPARKRPWWKFW